MEKEQSLVVNKIKNYNIQKPEEMKLMAVVLKDYIVANNLYTDIPCKDKFGNVTIKKYVNVEGWQFAGALLGTRPMIFDPINLSTEREYKYQVKVEVVDINDKVIGRGFALCSNKESKKATFDEYAVMSMAQTRAIGKAYRSIVGWVMKFAGYESTPAEEIKPEDKAPKTSKPTRKEVIAKSIDAINTMNTRRELASLRNKIVNNEVYREDEKTSLIKAIDERYAKI